MGESNDDAAEVKLPDVAETPRSKMISTAVHFLKNPKVRNSPLPQKKAFLLKKGLTENEVMAALYEAYSDDINGLQQEMVKYNMSNNLQGSLNVPLVPTPLPPVKQYSVWSQVNRIGSTVVILGIALYGIHRFYKLYIEPWLYGEKERDHLSQLEEHLLEVNRSLSQLKRSVSSIEEVMGLQKEQLHKCISEKDLNTEQYVKSGAFVDMKTDIATIKSLLLNRHQFPEIPKITPTTIPSWQLPEASSKKTEDELPKDESGEKQLENGCAGDNVPVQNGLHDDKDCDSEKMVNQNEEYKPTSEIPDIPSESLALTDM